MKQCIREGTTLILVEEPQGRLYDTTYPFDTSAILNIISHYFDLIKTMTKQTFVKLFCKNYKICEKEISL